MNNLKKVSLALVSAGLLALALPGAAQADVMASSMVNMTNFVIKDATTNTQLDTSNFSFFTFTSSADYSGSLPGTPGFSASSSAAPINFPAACVGSGCGAWNAAYGVDNSFTKMAALPVGNYAAADQGESGAPITGIVGLPSPANVASASYAGLTSQNALSSANSNNNLNSSFVFTLAKAGGLTFSFDVDAYLQAFVAAGEKFPGFATASYQIDFSIKDLSTNTNVWTFAPDVFGNGVKTLSLNAPLPVNIQSTEDTGGVIGFSSTTAALNNTDLYQLSARIQTNADAQRIPEPGVLALLGVGLLGFGLSRRRKAA